MKISALARVAVFAAGMATAVFAYAQNFPSKPIRIITSTAGGNSDTISRLLAHGMTEEFRQPVIVVNQGGGVIPIVAAERVPADGYSMLYYGSGFWVEPALEGGNKWEDRLRKFMPVSVVISQPVIVTVHPSVPAQSIKELIALAKAKPGVLNYGATSVGSTSHLTGEMFRSLAGVDIVTISYKGTNDAIKAILSGEIQLLLSPLATSVTHIKSGKIRALAVTSAKRSEIFPDLPTVAEAGLPDMVYGQNTGTWLPAGTSPAIAEQLSKTISRVINSADSRKKLGNDGTTPEGTSPKEAMSIVNGEIAVIRRLIKEGAIKVTH